jgi:L-iditol 2-dehydrogenase
MRVARLHAWGDVRVETAAVPRPAPGELLIRIDACGVCGTDALAWYVARKAPAVLGHEPVGTIVAGTVDAEDPTGSGARLTLRPGTRVFAHHHAPCLACAACRRRLWASCDVWRGAQLRPGGFAEYAVVGAQAARCDVLPLPDTLGDDAATFVEPVACCLRALHTHGRLAAGESVLVVGLGANGLVLVQLARAAGAGVVLGSDFLPGRRELARALGADATIDAAAADASAAVRAGTEGRGADVVIITPGDAAAVNAGIACAAPGARVVCFTPSEPGRPLAVDAATLYFREITLAQSYSCGPDETRAALALLVERRLDVAPIVTHHAGLDGVGAALDRAHHPDAGIKTVIVPAAH